MFSPAPPHPFTSSPLPTLPEIVFLLGHLSTVGSCRCCCWLWSWEEVPATPESKCFLFHFPVLVFFFRCERRGGIPLGVIGTRVFSLFFPWSTGKPALCVWIFVSSKRRILFYWGGIPVYFDYSEVEAKSFKTYLDISVHMHTKRVTHSIVWCTAEISWDLLWVWELMPSCAKRVHCRRTFSDWCFCVRLLLRTKMEIQTH